MVRFEDLSIGSDGETACARRLMNQHVLICCFVDKPLMGALHYGC